MLYKLYIYILIFIFTCVCHSTLSIVHLATNIHKIPSISHQIARPHHFTVFDRAPKARRRSTASWLSSTATACWRRWAWWCRSVSSWRCPWWASSATPTAARRPATTVGGGPGWVGDWILGDFEDRWGCFSGENLGVDGWWMMIGNWGVSLQIGVGSSIIEIYDNQPIRILYQVCFRHIGVWLSTATNQPRLWFIDVLFPLVGWLIEGCVYPFHNR